MLPGLSVSVMHIPQDDKLLNGNILSPGPSPDKNDVGSIGSVPIWYWYIPVWSVQIYSVLSDNASIRTQQSHLTYLYLQRKYK